MSTGLTLGKFAPLHKGHQYLIETAVKETDHLIVVIYDSQEVTDVPLDVRANWIRKLYPNVEIIEGWDGPSDMGDTLEIKAIQEKYILGLMNGRKITHFYSSEFYGDHMSKALGAINRQVDANREAFPVSGTAIRENIWLNRKYLPDIVYKELITNVVFLGAPSTGKTTIAEQLAKDFNTQWMPEYAREYWEKNQVNRRLTHEQLLEIVVGHFTREEAMLGEANQYLFTDTNAITTYMFSQYYHGNANDNLTEMASMAEKRYDLVFLCDIDIPYDDTWDRSGDANRKYFQEEIIKDLDRRKLPYVLLSGTLSERVEKVKGILKNFNKFNK